MTEKYALIKKIGDEYIYVENAITSCISNMGIVVWGIIIIGSSMGWFFGMDSSNNLGTKVMASLAIGLISGVISTMFIYVFEVFLSKTPQHKVYLGGTNNAIYISKTDDPEQDQVAICKAAQELEIIAIQRNREKNELERIASKCK